MTRNRRVTVSEFCRFPTTRWTLVRGACDRVSEDQRQALNEVLSQYWPAIRAHLVIRKGVDPNDADDLVQSFVTDSVLDSDLLAAADQDRGKFRSLLVKSLENYLANQLRRRNAKKRQAERAVSLSDETLSNQNATTNTPDKISETAWAQETLAIVLQQMKDECHADGREDLWTVFQGRILGPILDGAEPTPYDEIVRRGAFESTTQAQNALVTAKRMFCRTMRSLLQGRGAAEADVDAEIRDLEQCLSAY
ncbi:hypothetical protein Enr13x_18550 [Stieleria neptunia]|uniref:RNA polymerase sigma factor n=1 Tax=Stieleria neptunia TaxID=2527979 RepID=A0A518HMC5_9BACT|nr:sigma-70 family RNA polymerase sigma factor [Stieleria neptunia]QDV42012.1 hypothetical protein Enr13x_18550 [Stieleria neptunia]